MTVQRDIPITIASVELGDQYDVVLTIADPLTGQQATTALTMREAADYVQEIAEVLAQARDTCIVDLAARTHTTVAHGFDIDWAIHPECAAGKCRNCDGETMDVRDQMVPCAHRCHTETAEVRA